MEWLENLLGIGANYAAGAKGINDAKALGQQGYNEATALGTNLAANSQFQPYTVTSGLGNVATNAQGGFTSTLSPELQAAQDSFRNKGMNLLDIASQPLEGRSQDIFNSLDAARMPQRDRERLQMEERMFNQGRSGVNTAMFGGTPEQFAMEQAMAEQSSADAFASRQQAIQEQGQFADLGRGLFGDSFTPQSQLLQSLLASHPTAGIADIGRRQGVQTQGALGQSAIESLLGGGAQANNLQQQQMQGLMNMILGQQPTIADKLKAGELDIDLGSLGSGGMLGGLFGNIFGGGSGGTAPPSGQIATEDEWRQLLGF